MGETSLRVLPDADGNGIDDLRTAEDNMRAADFMLGVIRQYTEDPSTLVSRVQSVAPAAEVYPTMEIDAWHGCLLLDGKEVGLAPTEFAALVLLAHKEGSRFASDEDKDNEKDLSKVLSSLRAKLSKAGLPNVEGLVPKRGRPVAFPVERMAWKNQKELADICGCLFSHGTA